LPNPNADQELADPTGKLIQIPVADRSSTAFTQGNRTGMGFSRIGKQRVKKRMLIHHGTLEEAL
jgi:hypothetical protein